MILHAKGSNKKNFFFNISRKGGGLVESKISLTEKTEIVLDFLPKGGLTQSKRVLAENWAKYPKNRIFFGYFAQNCFFWIFFRKGGGGPRSFGETKKKQIFFLAPLTHIAVLLLCKMYN